MAEKKMFSATGNQMVADAFRQVNPDVMAAYPITPQTTIVEGYAKFVADGKVTTEYVPTESEHSALSALRTLFNTRSFSIFNALCFLCVLQIRTRKHTFLPETRK